MSFSEPEFSTNIPFSILEYQNTSFEDLDGKFHIWSILRYHLKCRKVLAPAFSQIHIGLFSSGNAPVHLCDLVIFFEFMDNNQSPGVQNLIHRGPIILIPLDGVYSMLIL